MHIILFLYKNKFKIKNLHHKRKEIKILNPDHVEVRVVKVQSFIWDCSLYQTVIKFEFNLLSFWTNGLALKPRTSVSSETQNNCAGCAHGRGGSYSCFMFPQIKEICCRKIRWPWTRARFLTEPVSGSCVSWTKPDYDLLQYFVWDEETWTQYGFF